MKRIIMIASASLAVLAGVRFLFAQDGPAARGGKVADRAVALRKLFPEADTDKDGKLSMPEAFAYVETHPELKALFAALQGSRANVFAAPPRTTPPGRRSTPASKNLSPGPRVFVCAHSFMIFTGQLLPPIAEAAGIAYRDAGTQMIGGSSTIKHWNVPDDQNLAKRTLKEGSVDVLLLSPLMILPDAGIDNFVRLGLEKNPDLRVLVQASWPIRDSRLDAFTSEMRNAVTPDDLRWQRETYESTWVKALEAQVKALNAAVGKPAVRIVPVGKAVFALRERVIQGTAPGLRKQTDLFRDAQGHPKPPLAALVTYCHFAAVYGRSPVGLPVPADLKSLPHAAELNTLLQELAWQAVSAT
jgi:hypothetical protein